MTTKDTIQHPVNQINADHQRGIDLIQRIKVGEEHLREDASRNWKGIDKILGILVVLFIGLAKNFEQDHKLRLWSV